jgi:signal transduction histidine kinase
MAKFDLGTRLFFSHLLATIVGLSSFIFLAKSSSPQLFVLRLQQLEQRGFFTIKSAKNYLVEGFETAWNKSAFWAIIVGGSAAAGLSYFAAQRLAQRLDRMGEITQKFAAGELQERMSENDIPELDRLSFSFNLMAESLENVEQKRRELIGDMTHELRTPLTVVRGYLEELSDGTIEPSTELYMRLVRETRRLQRLIEDMQELSKAETGNLSVKLQTIDLHALLQALVDKFADQIFEDGPILKLEYPQNLPLVLADIDRTEQILINLLGNAIRYTEKGAIIIRAWREKDRVWIAVSDTGIGIAEEDLPFVFERFWRADRSRSRYSGGTGIGLSIARSVVQLQGGTIEVSSELGKGSTFKFCLNLA